MHRRAERLNLDLSTYPVHAPRGALGRSPCAEALLLLALGLRRVLVICPLFTKLFGRTFVVPFWTPEFVGQPMANRIGA